MVEPAGPLTAVPPVARLRLDLPAGATTAVDASRVHLLQGTLTTTQAHALQRGDVAATMAARMVPALVWLPPSATGSCSASGSAVEITSEVGDGALWLAPEAPLTLGATYTFVSGTPAMSVALQVIANDPVPFLPRVWPPAGGAASAGVATWCGTASLPPIDAPVRLAPSGVVGRIRRGALVGDVSRLCVHLEASDEGDSSVAAVPPPLLAAGDAWVRLDPDPLKAEAPAAAPVALACTADEQPFGPGCVKVVADRLEGRSPAVPLLWAIHGDSLHASILPHRLSGDGIAKVFTTEANAPFVVEGLWPSSRVELWVGVADNAGGVTSTSFHATTTSAASRVIVNEVLANPFGPEPQEEWVELFNDGDAAADLAGYVLTDAGGQTVLPSAVLPAKAFALLVNDTFVPNDGSDPAPAAGTLLLHVAKLGHDGLSNAGEALTLADANGVIVSTFPAIAAKKGGMSAARTSPSAPEGVASSYVIAVPTPGSPNAP